MSSSHKLAQVIALHSQELDTLVSNTWQLRTLRAIEQCRTGALGGHIAYCKKCKKTHHHKHSCRNRHCPNCQGHKQAQWQQARASELINAPYFHVVFTLPSALNSLALHAPRELYGTLFKAAWETINQFAKNELNAKMGMIAVLHTWGQNLSLHPHLHCIVPKGGITKAGYWRKGKGKSNFLFPVKAMSKTFRGIFMKAIAKEVKLPVMLKEKCYSKKWVIHTQPPQAKPEQIIEYLARYTQKTAISNNRIKHIDKQSKTVTFSYKSYKCAGQTKLQTLATKEFIRRFAQHILPKGFRKIRHYGFLSSTWKKEKLPHLQLKLTDKDKETMPEISKLKTTKLNTCVHCGSTDIVVLLSYDKRGPPDDMEKLIKSKLNKINIL